METPSFGLGEGILMFFTSIFWLLVWLLIILTYVSLWRIYKKAGKPGWGSIIPIYNLILWLEMAGKPAWWIFLFFIPVVNIILAIQVNIRVAENFGKSAAFGGLGLSFLGFVFCPLLASSEVKYVGQGKAGDISAKEEKRGLFLSTFLIYLMISSPLAIFSSLIAAFTEQLNYTPLYPRWTVWISSIILLVYVVSAIAIWMWHKWGVYAFGAASLLMIVINLMAGFPLLSVVFVLMNFAILLLLVLPRWQLMDGKGPV
jgi:hypothetical protein